MSFPTPVAIVPSTMTDHATASQGNGRALDPITFAVVGDGLISAAHEMYWVFKRTAMLPLLYEFNDFGMSLFDDRLNMVADAARISHPGRDA